MGVKYPFDPKKYPNCINGHNYALAVLSGKINANKYVKGACQRYLNDLEDPKYYFEVEKAEKFLRLVQRFEHVIGEWKTKEIIYEPWQCFGWMNIIGFYSRETKFRRFRIAHWEIGRGNGKSLLASQAVLYFLALDNPNGNQISTVATGKEQARIVLDSARAMASKAISYRQATGVKVLAHSITHPKSNSKVRALASEGNSLDGLNDILAVCDELHAMKRETFDVIYSGMSKRRDSLTLCITTAGFNMESVGYSQSVYAKKVSTGEVEDDQFFAMVYTLDDGDDIFDESNWIKANPNWGVSVDPVTFRAKAEKAKIEAADIPNFKVKHLNMWLSEANAFYSTDKWDLCADPTISMDDFKGQPVIIGLDLANKIDIASIAYVYKKDRKYYLFDKSYLPKDRLAEIRNTLYDNCIGSGHLIGTQGEAINYDILKQEILQDSKKFRIQEVLFDPWNATGFAQELIKERINCIEFRMNTGNLSEPTKQLDALMREGRIVHNGSPLLRWCLSNVVCKYDAADNVFPKKSHERLKIDPIIAILMALASWIQKDLKENVYESRGIRSF